MSNAIIYIKLDRKIFTALDYNAATAAMSARCGADGVVWNAEDSEPRFEGARVHVQFLNGIDGRMKKYADEHGLPGACGSIQIAKDLESETLEYDGETTTSPQITLWMGIDRESFKSIESGLMFSARDNGRASMTVNFSHHNFSRMIMPLEALDLSRRSDYPIVSFSLNCSNDRTIY